VFFSVLHCFSACCTVFQRVAGLLHPHHALFKGLSQSVAVCCNVLQCVVVCCSVLQCVALCRSVS